MLPPHAMARAGNRACGRAGVRVGCMVWCGSIHAQLQIHIARDKADHLVYCRLPLKGALDFAFPLLTGPEVDDVWPENLLFEGGVVRDASHLLLALARKFCYCYCCCCGWRTIYLTHFLGYLLSVAFPGLSVASELTRKCALHVACLGTIALLHHRREAASSLGCARALYLSVMRCSGKSSIVICVSSIAVRCMGINMVVFAWWGV